MTPHPLDNPTWHALTGRQAALAEGVGQARRFRPDVSMFAAISEDTPAAWADLAAVSGDATAVIVNRVGTIAPPPGWTVLGGGPGFQMVLSSDPPTIDAPPTRPLDGADVPAMLELIGLTEPGPFQAGTIELGGYVGIELDGRLLAMAGQRVELDGYTEISAVCTHPDARRRGFAAAVTAAVARSIRAAGNTPVLHVAEPNVSAKRVYENLGFTTRTVLTFTALRAP